MGLRDLNSIDIVVEAAAFEPEVCKLILIIIDATSDLSDDERYTMLLRKLTSYYSYVAGPGLGADHPGLRVEDVIVRVLTVTPPTQKMLQVDAIKGKDEGGRLRVYFGDYHAYMARIRGTDTGGVGRN
jgi:hypothetical protein